MKNHKINVLIEEEKILKRINEVAQQINKDYEGKSIRIICILKGGVFFMTELAKRISVPLQIDFMKVSSYGNSTKQGDTIQIQQDIDVNIENEHIIIVEDIIDTGNTLSMLSALLKSRNPASLEICSLLDKPECRQAEVSAKYCCFCVPDKFVVGWGLDYAQQYRNLSYIGAVEFID